MMDKLKVLIVDDETLIRNLLRMRIDWEGQGMTIVGEASQALEALVLMDEQRPDIVFTDIYMPTIDGIEFSRRVLEKYPDTQIVVVTGHDEFEFAQKGIKIGIADFILKPIRAAELLGVTDKLRKKIYEERIRVQELDQLREELRRNYPLLKGKFMNQWVSGTLPAEEFREKAEYFNLRICEEGSEQQIAVMEISATEAHQTEADLMLGMECRNRTEAFFREDQDVVVFADADDRIVILSMRRNGNLVDDCERLQVQLLASQACFVNIGVGRRREGAMEIRQCYREACRALQYKAFVGNNQVICFDDIVDRKGQSYHSDPDLLQQLQFHISVGSAEEALRVLKRMFDVPFSSVSQFRLAAMDVIKECQHAAIEQELENDNVLLDKETLISILTADTLPQAREILEHCVHLLSGAIDAKIQAKANNLISRVKAYLEDNISDPGLGIASTAAAFFVSPGHLGRLMKKETGQTYVEYLTNLRMKKAETLLKTTDLLGYQVGEKVGIPDPHYFSTLFKKNTGRSVNEYRSRK
ncbi:response regulator [Paenibacillus sp. TRM 82003]|nr:response regulator [Paenibacillus sp. TRM 82003]